MQQQDVAHKRGADLSDLLATISLGIKLIAREVAHVGIPTARSLAKSMEERSALSLDEAADSILVDLLSSTGHLGLLVSEARETVVATAISQSDARYVVAIDPLDGVANLGSNIPVGTSFIIFQKKDLERQAMLADFLQSGRKAIAAGYAIYGAKTDFVVSVGKGVHSFTLDHSLGEFILAESDIRVPTTGPWFSVNEGYSSIWEPEIKAFVEQLKRVKRNGVPAYMGRYVGSLVADFDRTLREGGIFMHPANALWPQGRLHLLYECMPLAFLMEQAGGVTFDFSGSILERSPKNIHDRCAVAMGSRQEMDLMISALSRKRPAHDKAHQA